jgi:hypothetical protein
VTMAFGVFDMSDMLCMELEVCDWVLRFDWLRQA